jgi:carbamoyltransferase
MNILGISAGFHDSGIALLNGSDIIYASHSERFSGKKHDSELSHDMIIDATSRLPDNQEIDAIAYYERPWMRYGRQLRTGEASWPTETDFSIRSILPKYLQDTPVTYYNHHMSHAASSFQTSDFQTATCIVIDAIGEFDTISVWDAWYDQGKAQYKRVWGKKYPNSIGMMYSAFTQRVGLKPMDDEYILMGMAAYGNSTHHATLRDALLDSDLNFKHNLHIGMPDDLLNGIDKFDLAASGQELTEQLLLEVFAQALSVGKSKNICYSGGVALNCVANGLLASVSDNLWIMPNPGDAGAALGAAALLHGSKVEWDHPYLGYDISPYTRYPVDRILQALHTDKIVGVAHGRAEFGPRALGNRSLMADPRGPEIKDKVNEIKHRQKFRPFAPMILEEHLHEYFDMPAGVTNSAYMQYTGICKYPAAFPAIVHEDGTSRVQTVSPLNHPGLYKLLVRWHSQTGCPMLLNTSLNIRGMPMVNNISDAKDFENEYNVKVIY